MKLNLNIFVLLTSLTAISVNFVSCKATGRATTGTGSTTVTFENTADLQIAAESGIGAGNALVIGRFSNDSLNDIVLLTQSSGALYYKNANGSWNSPAAITATNAQNLTVGVGANLDSGTLIDLIVDGPSIQPSIVLNGGADGGSFGSSTTFAPTGGSEPTAITYFRKSASATQGFAVVATSNTNHFYADQSAGTWGSETTTSGSAVSNETGVKVLGGDIDGDGRSDFALIPRTGTNSVEFWKNSADSSFTNVGTLTARSRTATINDATLTDMNDDGKPDLILATTAGLELYVNASTSGTISFTVSTTLTPSEISTNATTIVVADFTGDENPDIFLTRSGAKGILFSNNGSLVFSNISTGSFGTDSALLVSDPVRAYAADINNDGAIDLIELSSTGAITVHKNIGT